MRTLLISIGAFLSIPLLVLNWTSAIIGGVWLCVFGEWQFLLIGIPVILFGYFLLSLVLMIGFGIAALGARVGDRAPILATPFFWLAHLFNFAVVVAGTIFIFESIMSTRTHLIVWPYLLWAYAVSTTPWASLAQKEISADPSSMTLAWVSAVQFGAVAVACSLVVGNGIQSEFGMALFCVPASVMGLVLGFALVSERGLQRRGT